MEYAMKHLLIILLMSAMCSCSKQADQPIQLSLPNRPGVITVEIKVYPFKWSDATRWTVEAIPHKILSDTVKLTVKWYSGIYNYSLPMKIQPNSQGAAYYTNALVLGSVDSVKAVAEKSKYLVTFKY